MGRNSCIVKEPEELSWDCQSKEDGICNLPIGTCKMCSTTPRVRKKTNTGTGNSEHNKL